MFVLAETQRQHPNAAKAFSFSPQPPHAFEQQTAH
jgi:hypothetical protein